MSILGTLMSYIFLISLKISLIKTWNYIFPCYYYYEPQVLTPELIPADLCTHIILFGCIQDDSNSSQARLVQTPFNCSKVLEKLSYLKKTNKNLKLVLSMSTNSASMHEIVKTNDSISLYALSAIKIAAQFNFDGIDFDWEYPCGEDKYKFTILLQTFTFFINKYKLNLKLSAAIGASLNTIQECYDLDGLISYLDYINVMCYDYNTIYNTYTAYASPLYARPEETGSDLTLNTNFTINYLIENKVPREKIILGLNAGGHTFQLKNPNSNGFHAPVLGVGYSSGWSLYPQLCKLVKNGGIAVYDDIAEVLYAYYEDQWTNTGDVNSARAKSIWAKSMRLGGVFTWCLNWDDLSNSCEQNTSFPIHKTIKKFLFN